MTADIPTSARAVVLQNYETSAGLDFTPNSPTSTFAVKDLPIPSPIPDDSVLVQILYISNDPGIRFFTRESIKYEREDFTILPLGIPFVTLKPIGRVVRVGGKEEDGPVKVGDIVEISRTYWADYVVVKKEAVKLRKQIPGVSLSAYLGALGLSGATAYWALKGVLNPKPNDTIVISGAAGAVGNVAVQLAKKVIGVKRVVGIAGTEEKCKWLKNIGADEAVNYNSATFTEDLVKATPDKVDAFLDNVGGPVLDEVMMRMKPHAVVCAVGIMSLLSNPTQAAKLQNYAQILVNRLTLKGFTLFDYMDRLGEAEEVLADAAVSDKLIIDGAETVVDVKGRVEEIPLVWNGLFTGANTGKLVTKLAD